MANVALVFKKTRTQIGAVVLDASIQETHTSEVEVTEFPVEKGSNISDHRRVKPDGLVIEGVISNTPLPGPNDPTTRHVLKNGTEIDSRSSFQAERAGQAYADLLALKDSGELVTVTTGLRTYEGLTVVGLSVPRDARTGLALRFTIQLKEIRVVSSQIVEVRSTEPKTKKKQGLGKKAAQPVKTETKKTALKALVDLGVKASESLLK